MIRLILGLGLGVVWGSSSFARVPNVPTCIGHRGDSSVHLENSRTALLSAWKKGAGAIEFDVQHTTDGVGIINHDPTLARVASSKARKRCPALSKIASQTHQTLSESCMLKNGDDLQTLDEVLTLFLDKDIVMVVELKDAPSQSSLAALVRFAEAKPDHMMVISFKDDALDPVLAARSDYSALNEIPIIKIMVLPGVPDARFDGVAAQFITDSIASKMPGDYMVFRARKNDRYIRSHLDRGANFITTDYVSECVTLLRG